MPARLFRLTAIAALTALAALAVAPFAAPFAAPLAAQERSLVAVFSETQWREPTFVVSRASYVGVFELVGGTRVVQLYPRGDAAARTALPAGETPLAMLDVNLGRLIDAPGVRTVFWQNGTFDQRHMPVSSVTDARTLLLVASTSPLAVGLPSEFPARHARALLAVNSALPPQVRAVQAAMAAVHPALTGAELASDLQTMWLSSNPELRGSVASIGARDPYDSGLGCDAIYPYGYAAFTTYSSMRGCPDAFIPVWGYGWWVPAYPVFFTPRPAAPPATPTYGVPPVTPATSGRVRHVVDKAPIETVPTTSFSASSAATGSVQNIAGGGRVETVPMVAPPGALPLGGGGGSPRALGDRAQIREDVPRYARPASPAPPSGGTPVTPVVREAPRAVSAPAPVLVAPAPSRSAPAPAAASPAPRPTTGSGSRELTPGGAKPHARH